MSAAAEIAELRLTEARMDAYSSEADILIRKLLPFYACDFVLADVPDGMWFPLPVGWQAGIAEPIRPCYGHPPRDRRGAVSVSIKTLRDIARNA